MPTQAQNGFWICDYCGSDTFPSIHQAKAHESDCSKRQHSDPNASAQGYSMPPSETLAYSSHHPSQLDSPQKMRRFRLMGPGEGHHMDIGDAVACQNLEVFEATHELVAEHEASNHTEESICVGQVGIRCIHCGPGSAYNTFYPQVIADMATCIQVAADRHLSVCSASPAQVREPCEHVAARRRSDHEQRRAPSHDEERQHLALVDHCRYFAGNVGLIDKYPPKSGVVFRDAPVYRPADVHQPTPEHYPHGTEQPSSATRTPLAAVGGTPFQPASNRGPMIDNIAATPLARRNKQNLQDREYNPPGRRDYMMPPPSADRREYQPPSSEQEYHTFAPHLARGSYPSDAPPEHRTPVPPRRLDEPPDSAYQPTPQGFQPESPHAYRMPPSPYDMQPQGGFPYFQDVNGSWICCYCSHIHPQYRDQGAVWTSQNLTPPPAQVIDQHLSICRSYNQSLSSSYYEPPQPHYNYGPPPSKYGGQYHGGPGWGPPGVSPGYGPNDSSYSYLSHSVDQTSLPYSTPALEGNREPPPPRSSRAIPARGRPGVLAETTDHEMMKAIEILMASDKRHFGTVFREREERGQLVLDEDKLLLTDYFYHLMRQLRLCRFSESDRKTRGGKRENIAVGYGGLQCVHCSDAPNSRKFFWSNVDRLANSFAEIPAHVLKCRRCPNPVKQALMDLKRRHPEQMARLPRGSQKVFFRRMWRRLHDEDPVPVDKSKAPNKANEENVAPENKEETSESKSTLKVESSQGESPGNSSEESNFLIERTTADAAKVLADSTANRSASPSSRVLLAIADDKEWLSDMDCFVRRNLEVFCANEEDVEIAQQDRKYPVNLGQVGIRCVHCALHKGGNFARGTAVAFPYSINGIYESVREFQRLHLEGCSHLPDSTKKKLAGFKGSASLSSVLRKYYVLAAKALGMHDTPDGISSGGECVPIGSSAASAFSFPETLQETKVGGEQQTKSSGEGFLQGAVTPLESRKRKTVIPTDSMPSSASSKKSKDEEKESPLRDGKD